MADVNLVSEIGEPANMGEGERVVVIHVKHIHRVVEVTLLVLKNIVVFDVNESVAYAASKHC